MANNTEAVNWMLAAVGEALEAIKQGQSTFCKVDEFKGNPACVEIEVNTSQPAVKVYHEDRITVLDLDRQLRRQGQTVDLSPNNGWVLRVYPT